MIIIKMENGKEIKIELCPNEAPITVENFRKLVNEGFYDGLIFHRVISGFMIQGGDPLGNGMGGSKETIKGEFRANGCDNKISHKRGVISMARAQNYNSASSQFFIMHADGEFLDGQYAAFGRVIEGMDVVDEIASTPTDMRDRPLSEQKIASITEVSE
ncbi:MAG: peptidylprolyl isomerase [Firmicutes bacterium]|nr:peptidylprolyl isomerase [Bacillota bacterium]